MDDPRDSDRNRLNRARHTENVKSGGSHVLYCIVFEFFSGACAELDTSSEVVAPFRERSGTGGTVAEEEGSSESTTVHGSLARAGKVRSQTPKVDKQEKKKQPKGRAKKRMLYNRRFVNVTALTQGGKRRM
ncbi:RPS30A [Sanghuangporus vaninii]